MYIVVAVLTIAVNLGAGIADLLGARFVLANSAELNIDRTWLPALAWLKIAGAAGLVVGLLGIELLGFAAAVGLVLFFTGAVAIHMKAKVFHNIAYPLACLALAVATLVLA